MRAKDGKQPIMDAEILMSRVVVPTDRISEYWRMKVRMEEDNQLCLEVTNVIR